MLFFGGSAPLRLQPAVINATANAANKKDTVIFLFDIHVSCPENGFTQRVIKEVNEEQERR